MPVLAMCPFFLCFSRDAFPDSLGRNVGGLSSLTPSEALLLGCEPTHLSAKPYFQQIMSRIHGLYDALLGEVSPIIGDKNSLALSECNRRIGGRDPPVRNVSW